MKEGRKDLFLVWKYRFASLHVSSGIAVLIACKQRAIACLQLLRSKKRKGPEMVPGPPGEIGF
jgi:hypothetical protein